MKYLLKAQSELIAVARIIVICVALAWIFASAVHAENTTDPAEPVLQLRAGVRDLAQKGWPPPQAEVAALIEKTFDLGRITDVVLSTHAADASAQQKARLARALALRMAREAMRVPVEKGDDSFTVLERRSISGTEWLVITRAEMPAAGGAATSAPREQAVVSWRVAQGAQGLRIVDMLRDGISAVLTQRDDFAAALGRQDLDTVISEVERRAVVPPTN